MIHATVEGRIGKDAETKQVGDSSVTSFSIASNFYAGKGKGDEYNGKTSDYGTQWVDVSVWGARGEGLREKARKGALVVAIGEMTTREYNGKTYLQVKAEHVRVMAPAKDGNPGSSSERSRDPHDQRGGYGGGSSGGGYGGGQGSGRGGSDDDIPF